MLWLFLYCVVVLVYLFELCHFMLHMTVGSHPVVLYHLPAQLDTMLPPLMFHPVIVNALQCENDLLIKIFNELYDRKGWQGRKVVRKFRDLSGQELLALGAGIVFGCIAVMYMGIVVIFHDMPQLVINSPLLRVPKSSLTAVVLLTMLETWVLSVWTFNLGFFVALNCLVISKVEDTLSKMTALMAKQ